MNIDLIAYHGFDLDLKSLTRVTKCTTLAQIVYTLLQNSRKKRVNEMVELLFLSRQYPVPCPPHSPAAERPTFNCIRIPDICFLLS